MTKLHSKPSPKDIKLIISDLDGTLLLQDKSIPDGFYEMHSQIINRGILFGIASGRQYATIANLFSPISNTALIIAENGAHAGIADDLLVQNGSAIQDYLPLIETANKLSNGYAMLCGKESAWIGNSNPEWFSHAAMYYKKLKAVDDLSKVNDSIYKFSVCDFEGAASYSAPLFKKYEPEFDIVVSGPNWLDISKAGINKGLALRQIQNHLQITSEQTLVFGDYLNDLEMFDLGWSVATANAHPLIKEKANEVSTFSNRELAVLRWLDDWFREA